MQPRAKKSLGQHFLKDAGISAKIVDLLHPAAGDQVLEIGPGPGALTHLLASHPLARLHLVEKDDHWAAVHAHTFAARPEVSVDRADALAFDWTGLDGTWKIISNLPYNVASPLIWDIVSRTPHLARCVFMVQKEVGDRLAAPHGGRDYGGLSVWVQSFARVSRAFIVGPGSFSPPPKVDSAVVVVQPLLPAQRPTPQLAEALAKTVRVCFQQRRKQLQSILRHHGIADAAERLCAMGIDPAARPETLHVLLFHDLASNFFMDTPDSAPESPQPVLT